MKFNAYILIPTFLGLTLVQAQQKNTGILPNENLITENIAAIPKELAVQVKKYSEARGASLAEIHPVKTILSLRLVLVLQHNCIVWCNLWVREPKSLFLMNPLVV